MTIVITVPESSSSSDRRDVALAGHLGNAAVARTGLRNPDPAVRATALGALERLSELSDDDITAALSDSDPRVRRRAAMVAAKHPGVSLLGALADDDVNVAESAAWATGEQNRPDADRLEALIEMALKHEDALCREAAVAALGALADERGLPAILAATADKPAIRRRAIIALAPFEGQEVTTALEKALTDRDWQVRQAAEDLLAG